ncbi:hypothetical protein BaRGS_00005131, partial [Batillaria attramentaria]
GLHSRGPPQQLGALGLTGSRGRLQSDAASIDLDSERQRRIMAERGPTFVCVMATTVFDSMNHRTLNIQSIQRGP